MARTPSRFSQHRETKAAVSEPAPAPASSKRTVRGSGPNIEAMKSATGVAVRNWPSSSCRLLGFSMAASFMPSGYQAEFLFAIEQTGNVRRPRGRRESACGRSTGRGGRGGCHHRRAVGRQTAVCKRVVSVGGCGQLMGENAHRVPVRDIVMAVGEFKQFEVNLVSAWRFQVSGRGQVQGRATLNRGKKPRTPALSPCCAKGEGGGRATYADARNPSPRTGGQGARLPTSAAGR